jgi:uncharacterized membrane protein
MISPTLTKPAGSRASMDGVRPKRSIQAPLVWAVLAVLLLVVGVWLLTLTRGSTLWVDEWSWALHRRGNDLDAFLQPHNDHLSLVPVAIYRALFATAGLDHYGPYRVLVVAAHLGCVLLTFVYARRRVGDLVALLAAASLLMLGPAWQNILWPFQIGWLISVAAGVGTLLALDRRDRAGDITAAGLLAIALGSSGVGVPFAIGAVIEVLLTRPRAKLWIVAVPLLPYAVWWKLYEKSEWAQIGHASGVAHPLLDGIWRAPSFAVASAASTMSSLAGLGGNTGKLAGGPGTFLTYGPVLLLAAAVLVGWRLHQLGRVPARVLTLGAIAVSFWVFTAITRGALGEPYTSRYLYVGGIVMLLLAVELLQGIRLTTVALAVIGVAVLAACLSNVQAYRIGAAFFVKQGQLTRMQLAALDLTRGVVKPTYEIDQLSEITAGDYFAAEAADGTPATPTAALAAAPDYARTQFDTQLLTIDAIAPRAATGAEPAGPRPTVTGATGGAVRPAGSCVGFRSAGFSSPAVARTQDVVVPAGGVLIRAEGGDVGVGARRYGDEFQPVGAVSSQAVVRFPRDAAPRPWLLRLTPASSVSVCGLP